MIEIDLEHPSIAGVEAGDLPSALVFGTGSGVVAAAWVAGRRVYARENDG